MRPETKKKNPFRVSYFSIVFICCLALSIIFYWINARNSKQIQEMYNRKKAELVLKDFMAQLQLMEEISLRIAISNEYQPSYFRQNKYNERVLLKDFEKYRFYSSLVSESFLYYDGNSIFHSSGFTMDLNAYLKTMPEEERERLREEMTQLKQGAPTAGGAPRILSRYGRIYVMFPFRVGESAHRLNAVLCFVIESSDLEERFQIVSGGMKGKAALYRETELLYTNQEEACFKGQKHVLVAESADGIYTLCYLPEKELLLQSGLILPQTLLVTTGIILIFLLANAFAERSYRPLIKMSEKYRNKVSVSKDVTCKNALEEINYMMDSMLRSNVTVHLQIEQKQSMLKNQILGMIIDGSSTFDLGPYLDRLQIRLPGPWFYVISISFEKEEGITEEFLNSLKNKLEQISSEEEKEYVYGVCNLKEKWITAICSISGKERKEELTEIVCSVAESFEYEPLTGSGSLYQSISRISASWLESVDNMKRRRDQAGFGLPGSRSDSGSAQARTCGEPNGKERASGPGSRIRNTSGDPRYGFIYETEELKRICAALAEGNEAGALEALNRFVKLFEREASSLLMQQYIFADFLSEVTRLARRDGIELSNQSISLIIAAKNAENFKKAAEDLIHDFCEAFLRRRDREEEEETRRICKYISEHFAQYDLSIESVAEELNVGTAAVRQAVFRHTGRLYKDYLISLRIEYAKTLLLENMTADETCRRVGYSSISYFTKLFKEITGVTPAKYKRGEEQGKNSSNGIIS